MKYRVRAVAKEGREGFCRSGLFFSANEWTILTAEQLTDEIRNEPQLLVEQVTDTPAGEDPGQVIGRLQRENATLTQERDDARAEAEKLRGTNEALRSENATLKTARDAAEKAEKAAETNLKPHKEQVGKLTAKVEELKAELAAAEKAAAEKGQ